MAEKSWKEDHVKRQMERSVQSEIFTKNEIGLNSLKANPGIEKWMLLWNKMGGAFKVFRNDKAIPMLH